MPNIHSSPVLQLRDVSAWYGPAQVLFGVEFQINRGEVLALLGRNGAGKTTCLKTIIGLMAKQSGEVQFLGQKISKKAPYQNAKLGLGYVPEDRRIFTELTVLENLSVGEQAPRFWPDGIAAPTWTREKIFELFPNLAAMPNRLGGQMSGGEQQMLAVARTLMGNPLVALLDEPSEGVAPIIVDKMADVILELKKQGVSILVSEQNRHFAARIADRAVVLDRGKIQFNGSFAQLQSDDTLRSKYLSI